MTPAEAIKAVEALFLYVHREVGYPTPYEDQAGKVVGDGPRDMLCAPNGEPYDVVTSFGINEQLASVPVLFASEGLAMQWWHDEVRDYQKATGAQHLYWCREPSFVTATYLTMDQGGLLRTQNPLAERPQVELGFVTSKLLMSKVGPDGKESQA